MTKRIYSFLLASLFSIAYLSAQDQGTISDEMTKNPDQNKQWRMGEYKYSAKPKNAWELGIHAGHYAIVGDVDASAPAGFGLGLHLRKAINYVFSIRGDFFYGQTKGLDPQVWTTKADGGGLVEYGAGLDNQVSEYSLYEGTEGWFPAYQTTTLYGGLQGVLNLGNLLFHKDRNKWNLYTALGIGLSNSDTKIDLLDGSGNNYSSTLRTDAGFTLAKLDERSGRNEIKDAINDIYDGDYETDAPRRTGDGSLDIMWTASIGIARKISKRFNIGLEHQVMFTDNDYLDGVSFRNALDKSNSVDVQHYTNIRLAINLGSLDKGTEPLYWLNPLDQTFNDIAELKQRPVLDLTDDDGDGIVDMLDQELDTPEGCPVDTRGVKLDSDNDGKADCMDKEPFSPPGYDVDENGVAMVPKYLSEGEINTLVDGKSKETISMVETMMENDCGKWFLPMIHFDLDKSTIKPEFYGHMHHVANVLKMCPDACVAVVGHTDPRNSNDYNKKLSYKRSKAAVDYLTNNYDIPAERFKLMYGGEESLLSNSNSANAHYMNRRVEFRVCEEGDENMPAPDGAQTSGGGNDGRSTGSTYSGNKNSGY
jgi:OOP family OmpA-OmpF porin